MSKWIEKSTLFLLNYKKFQKTICTGHSACEKIVRKAGKRIFAICFAAAFKRAVGIKVENMEIYESLLEAVSREYDTIALLKESERGRVSLVRHRGSGTRYIFRHFSGSGEVYQKLLGVSCRNLPQIMEVGEKNGQTVALEEYIPGDTLGEILEGGLLSAAQAKQVTRQLCGALWVLHSRGMVHRDVKPDNVILRGDEAVLIDFDAARVYKSTGQGDTQILGTTGFAAPEQYGLSQSDGRADIYAVGVLLNIMLTGEHPSRKLAKGRMGRIVQRCTMVNPEKRYKNILHLMEAL